MLRWIRRFVSATVARARFEREMRRELLLHVEHRADDLEAAGMPRDEALRHARVEFGALEHYKEECRDARGFSAFRPLHGLGQDLRFASRRLAATPGFFLFAVASLAAGVAVTTVTYALLHSIFWKSSGAESPERVLLITAGDGPNPSWQHMISAPDFEDLQRAQTHFASLGAAMLFGHSLRTPRATEMVSGEAVTADYFQTLGARAVAGTLIGPEHTDLRVIVLGESLWRTRFAGDPSIVGRPVVLGGEAFDVIGVVAYRGLGVADGLSRDVWVPLNARAALAPVRPAERGRPQLSVIGRMKPGISQEAARAGVEAVATHLDAVHPVQRTAPDGGALDPRRHWNIRGLDKPYAEGPNVNIPALLLGLVCLVLVVACTNLANLMLARGTAREHEIAMRRALGASRWRLVREMGAEGAIIALAGGLLAVTLTAWLIDLTTLEIPIPRGSFSLEPELNAAVLGAALTAVCLSLLVFSFGPALQLTKRIGAADISSGAASASRERTRRQWWLVRAQVAICVCLFLIASILVRVIAAAAMHDPGIAMNRLALATVHYRLFQGWNEERGRRTTARAVEEIGREAGIVRAAASAGLPFGAPAFQRAAVVSTPDKPIVERGDWAEYTKAYEGAGLVSATPAIFETLGIPILAGRTFDHRDVEGAPDVAVVSQMLARRLFGTEDVVGRQILVRWWPGNSRASSPVSTRTVIAVARDTDSGVYMDRRRGLVYLPLAQQYHPDVIFIARTDGSPSAAARQIQLALRRAEPDLATGTIGPAPTLLAGRLEMARVAGLIAASLGLLTLLLAMIGLYGVESVIVLRRTREVGIRMALGAAASRIRRMVLRQGLVPVMQGVALGIVLGTIARMGLRASLFGGVALVDPIALVAVPAILGLAAVLACYLPARRASRVDPNVALREG